MLVKLTDDGWDKEVRPSEMGGDGVATWSLRSVDSKRSARLAVHLKEASKNWLFRFHAPLDGGQ